jgi:hypothetical protein
MKTINISNNNKPDLIFEIWDKEDIAKSLELIDILKNAIEINSKESMPIDSSKYSKIIVYDGKLYSVEDAKPLALPWHGEVRKNFQSFITQSFVNGWIHATGAYFDMYNPVFATLSDKLITMLNDGVGYPGFPFASNARTRKFEYTLSTSENGLKQNMYIYFGIFLNHEKIYLTSIISGNDYNLVESDKNAVKKSDAVLATLAEELQEEPF